MDVMPKMGPRCVFRAFISLLLAAILFGAGSSGIGEDPFAAVK